MVTGMKRMMAASATTMATVTKRVRMRVRVRAARGMGTAAKVAGDKEVDGKSDK